MSELTLSTTETLSNIIDTNPEEWFLLNPPTQCSYIETRSSSLDALWLDDNQSDMENADDTDSDFLLPPMSPPKWELIYVEEESYPARICTKLHAMKKTISQKCSCYHGWNHSSPCTDRVESNELMLEMKYNQTTNQYVLQYQLTPFICIVIGNCLLTLFLIIGHYINYNQDFAFYHHFISFSVNNRAHLFMCYMIHFPLGFYLLAGILANDKFLFTFQLIQVLSLYVGLMHPYDESKFPDMNWQHNFYSGIALLYIPLALLIHVLRNVQFLSVSIVSCAFLIAVLLLSFAYMFLIHRESDQTKLTQWGALYGGFLIQMVAFYPRTN